MVSIIESKLPENLALQWFREIHQPKSLIDKKNKFLGLLDFLRIERKALEYASSDLRKYDTTHGRINAIDSNYKETVKESNVSDNCLIHKVGNHKTFECRKFINMPLNEKYKLLRENFACYGCLMVGHSSIECVKRSQCTKNNCDKLHHELLHPQEENAQNHSLTSSNDKNNCLLPIMHVPIRSRKMGTLNVFWDSGATVSLISQRKAIEYGLKGTPVTLRITTIGGVERKEDSLKYTVPLIDLNGKIKNVIAYGIERITSDISDTSFNNMDELFNKFNISNIPRPSGSVDLLIGFDYAAWHPVKERAAGHLVVLSNVFGKCIAGSYIDDDRDGKQVMDVAVSYVSLSEFFTIESMGVETHPKCGGCRCGKCAAGSNNYTLKEERELALIKNNLKFVDDHWEAVYPWVKDPKILPDNRNIVMKKLYQTEKRLMNQDKLRSSYINQMDDMVQRKIARKLTLNELDNYKGPVHYVAHHAVIKESSRTTPVRIVFNSSANYKGHVLNEYWGKGPDAFINNLLGVLIRFREDYVGFVGDIRKMYHSVFTSALDQHCHRYLWRNMELTRDPDTYVITVVNFGDRPSGTIATVALKQTAEMAQSLYPEAASVVSESTYVDDIIDSVSSREKAERLTQEIESILEKGNFKMKEWTISGSQNIVSIDQSEEKVLGVSWKPGIDTLNFNIKLEVPNDRIEEHPSNSLTKRVALSIVNGIYDPLGLASPFTVRGKILLRKITAIEPKIRWDDIIPEDLLDEWIKFINCIPMMRNVSLPRCVKPPNAVGNPTLITFSDASENAFGACCYLRWKNVSGEFQCNLLMSKTRVAPIKRLTIVRLELSAAVLASRIRHFIQEKTRFYFERYVHIVDSEIIRAMIQKESYGFNTFVGTRIGEIQNHTEPSQWYWINGEKNIADIITRGTGPENIGEGSLWQKGPSFMQEPIDNWPISNDCSNISLPERNTIILSTEVNLHKQCPINIERYSKYMTLINVTAKILSLKDKHSLRALFDPVSAELFVRSELFWIIEAQRCIRTELTEGVLGKGRYKKLTPRLDDRGVFVIGGRAERWVEISYNKQELPILPKDHRLSVLYSRYIHNILHLGIDADMAKIRSVYWIIGLAGIVKRIRHNCTICKKKYLKLSSQSMGKLPIERLKPAPAFFHSMLDLFGPYTIRGEVNKRSSKKVYGVLITDLLSRAVYIDIATDYSADSFLLVFRRFVTIHGYPKVVYSDRGSQLTCASEEIQNNAKVFDWERVESFGYDKGLTWKFSPADSPWWNGCCEALVRSVKKAINEIMKEQRVSYNELLTIFFESANLVNERPIGIKSAQTQDFSYLCPNDMLLGRSTSRVPSGPFTENKSLIKRFLFVQSLIDSFWKKWTSKYFPSLLTQVKWHHDKRNIMVGDIVVIQDNDLPRGQWKLGRVVKTVPGIDKIVRRIEVEYKNKTNICDN